jgi:hypothetical protein
LTYENGTTKIRLVPHDEKGWKREELREGERERKIIGKLR